MMDGHWTNYVHVTAEGWWVECDGCNGTVTEEAAWPSADEQRIYCSEACAQRAGEQ